MVKRRRKKVTSVDEGNSISRQGSPPPRPWTAEEREAAVPLPLPTVSSDQKPQDKSRLNQPTLGVGKTSPAGRPE